MAVRDHHHSLLGLTQKDGWAVERELGNSYDHVNVGFQRGQCKFPSGSGTEAKGSGRSRHWESKRAWPLELALKD
jgi:hypothetical protein